jgi:hypothetical protein
MNEGRSKLRESSITAAGAPPFAFQRVGFFTFLPICVHQWCFLTLWLTHQPNFPFSLFYFRLRLYELVLIMPPRIIFLLLRIIPALEIHVFPMRLMFPIVVVNHLAMIPRMVIAVTSIVSANLSFAPCDQHWPNQSHRQQAHRNFPKRKAHRQFLPRK